MPPDTRPLTQAQRGLWLNQQHSGVPDLYNTAERLCLHGAVNEARLMVAITQTLNEAEGLHVVIDTDGAQPVQRVQRVPIPLPRIDFSAAADPEAAAGAWMDTALRQPIDFANGPLVQQALLRLGSQRYDWYLAIHHVLIDGFGFHLLQQRVAQLYRDPAAAPTFAPWSRLFEAETAYLHSPQRQQDRAFWAQRLTDLPSPPLRFSDQPPCYSTRLTEVNGTFSHSLRAALEQQAKAIHCHWTDWLYAAVVLLLHRRHGTLDIALGIPVLGRLGSSAARVPAMLMNLTLLRVHLPAGANGIAVAQAVHAELAACRPHQGYRFADLLHDLRATGGGQPFGVLVNILPFATPLDFGNLQAYPQGVAAGGLDDLGILLRTTHDGVYLELAGSPAVYTRDELEALYADLMALLTSFAQQPEQVQVAAAPAPQRREQAHTQLAEVV